MRDLTTVPWADAWKIRLLTAVRYVNHQAVERWSRHTFRRRRPSTTVGVVTVPAATYYGNPRLPSRLQVPRDLPPEAQLPFIYRLPYYDLSGMAFRLLSRVPLSRDTAWSPDQFFADAFPRNEEGWHDTLDDESFARLRLQGPNPFLLRRDGDSQDYVLDFAAYFDGVAPSVTARFGACEGGLKPLCIDVGDHRHTPGSPGWQRAKLITNALDARYSVFGRHLLDTHLLVGQAYALSVYALPVTHPLRAFLDLCTYGTLVVSDFAYRLLLSPSSYFITSHFIDHDSAFRLFENRMDHFRLEDLVVPKDIASRGIARIPDHPYVADATDTWGVFKGFVEEVIDRHYVDDAAVARDHILQRWHQRLLSLLPGEEAGAASLQTREQLVVALACLLQLQVVHEVCGDFSIYGQVPDAEHKKLVNLASLLGGVDDHPPRAADVFLYDQGAFAGRFNNGGNNMVTLPVERYCDDGNLCVAVHKFQGELAALESRTMARDRDRVLPFRRMHPSYWEMSISF